jgi:lysophospholipase L1-like esterase
MSKYYIANFVSLIVFSLGLLLPSCSAHAWPYSYKLLDLNGDCEVVGVVVGDSFSAGVGDNAEDGGFVERAAGFLPKIELIRMGFQGLETLDLLKKIEKELKGDSTTPFERALSRADFVVLDLGRNDRWNFGEPEESARNMWRIQKALRKRIFQLSGVSPVIVTSILMLPNRGSQGPWVAKFNEIIASHNTSRFPADLRFDMVSKRLIGGDQLHPAPEGHAALAEVLVNYIKKSLPGYLRTNFVDEDGDWLCDSIELEKWGTDPHIFDTDGDGVGDGIGICGGSRL